MLAGVIPHSKILERSSAQVKMKVFTPTNVQKVPTSSISPTATKPTPKTEIIPTSTSAPIDCSKVNITTMLQDIKEANLIEYISNLVDDDNVSGHDELRSRASGSVGNKVEALYIKSHYDKLGISNIVQNVPAVSSNNIIANIKGKIENEVYIVGGHYDSVTTAAADDNGSGTAVIMEVARAIMQSGFCPQYTLEFINFTGEELGLFGSIHYVKSIPVGKKIRGIINLDMVSNPSTNGDCVGFTTAPYNAGSVIAQKAVEMDRKYGIGLNSIASSGSVGASDHYPFEVKGLPAVFGTECKFNTAVYHKATDTSDKINYRQVTNTARVVAATLVELAGK